MDVVIDSGGQFQFTVPLALDGTNDGRHTFAVQATDVAGNTSPEVVGSFTLDTIAPENMLSESLPWMRHFRIRKWFSG